VEKVGTAWASQDRGVKEAKQVEEVKEKSGLARGLGGVSRGNGSSGLAKG